MITSRKDNSGALILHLETAGNVCSVMLALNGEILAMRESDEKNSHSRLITIFIDEVFRSAGRMLSELDAVAVSEGPGSYTGLRIGVATAKGLCYSLEKPLIAVPTLQSMAAGMAGMLKDQPGSLPVLFCPMLDARRMEVYSALFDLKGNQVRETRAEIIDEHSLSEELKNHRVIFAGEGAGKCKPLLAQNPNAFFPDDFRISAGSMRHLALESYRHGKFENTAYFEPAYLKDFVAGKPHVKGLR